MKLKFLFCALVAAAGCGDDTKAVGIVADALDFGQTDCGATALPHVLIVSNSSTTPFSFTTALTAGDASVYAVQPSSGSVVAGGQVELTVYSKPIPTVSATTKDLFKDTLTLTTDQAGDKPHEIALTQTAHGAILAFSVPTVAFATDTLVGATAQTSAVAVTNTGNSDTTVTFTASSTGSFTITPAGSSPIAGGGTLTGMVSYSPRAIGAIAETVSLAATGPQCGPAPTLAATGTGNVHGSASLAIPAVLRGRSRNSSATALCVVTTAGFVACGGTNQNGIRGAGPTIPDSASFNLVRTQDGVLDHVVDLDSGRGFYCAVRSTGDEWCWGDYLGFGNKGASQVGHINPYATRVTASGVKSVAGGYAYTCTVTDPGGVLSCGGTPFGNNSAPTSGWMLGNAASVSMSGGGGYALLADTTVMSFGFNTRGERGNNDPSNSAPSLVLTDPADPTAVFTGVTQISAGGNNPQDRKSRHACARTSDGAAWCWGKNRHGELGIGNTSDSTKPVQVLTAAATPLPNVTEVTTGQAHSCAISNGGVFCWGRNREGQLGTDANANDVNGFALPTNPALTNAVKVRGKGRTTCVVLSTGGVRCWGPSTFGSALAPTAIPTFEP